MLRFYAEVRHIEAQVFRLLVLVYLRERGGCLGLHIIADGIYRPIVISTIMAAWE